MKDSTEMASLDETLENLKRKLLRAQSRKAVLLQKSKLLEEELARARAREENSSELVQQLIERQRELNVMLNRSNMMLNRAQDVNSLLSLEVREIVEALPEPKRKESEERISRIQELFKQTGIQLSDEQPAALEESIEGVDAEFSAHEHADRKKALWGSGEPAVTENASQAEPVAEPAEPSANEVTENAKQERPSAKLSEPAVGVEDDPSVDRQPAEQELFEEPVVVGRRGYPLPAEEEDQDDRGSRIADAIAGISIFPPKFRRWVQRIGRNGDND